MLVITLYFKYNIGRESQSFYSFSGFVGHNARLRISDRTDFPSWEHDHPQLGNICDAFVFPPNLGCGQTETGFTGGVCSCKVAFLEGHCSLVHDDDDDDNDDDDGDHDDKFSTKD